MDMVFDVPVAPDMLAWLRRLILCLLPSCLALPQAAGAEARAAVATNFLALAEQLADRFEAQTQHRLTLSAGATGLLYAQIVRGAPFDAFLAADRARPAALIAADLALADSRFVYARGRLVLASRQAHRLGPDLAASLSLAPGERLAIAHPELAPYGLAAQQTLQTLGLWQRLAPQIVRGENIGQAFALTATGNATLGLVAKAQMQARPGLSALPVPQALHAPVDQEAVLLTRGRDNAAARAFLAYLRTEAAAALIIAGGYDVP